MPAPSSFRPSLETLETREVTTVAPLALPPQPHPVDVPALRRHVHHPHLSLPDAPPFASSRATFERNPVKFRLDQHGVLQTFTGSTQQWEPSPLSVARYTIALYRAYRQGDDSALPLMRQQARWLMSQIEIRRDAHHRRFWALPYSYGLPDFQVPASFTSSLATASTSCALYLAGKAQGRVDWQRMSYHLMLAFNVPVAQGGVRAPVGHKAAWYEEVSYPSSPPTHILNGHLYATSWLGWYSRTANLSPHARAWTHQLFQQGVNAARLLLPQFVDPQTGLSIYDLVHRGRFQNYHNAHVILLDYYFSLTRVAEFKQFANRWRGGVYPA